MLDEDSDTLGDALAESAIDAGGLTDLLRGSAADDGAPLAAGTRLGDVTIVRLIAVGGMGRVYEGLQGMPCRSVAVKVIRPGLLSPEAMRRFQFEAQILGRLTHPAVARIYSMGVEPLGETLVPYFVMEYVEEAKSLTAYAADNALSIRDRVVLFGEACRAVAHGHAKGVIHRDLKPGNILVDAHGQVKVIDFGVARNTDGDIARTTMHTDAGQIVGTLCYMAPEQFHDSAATIDVRADVYTLGVVLYELLTGRLPYEIQGCPIYEVARVVKEVEPRSPSAIVPSLRGDAATIVGKCLEKERAHRYATAADLEADVARFLRGEPLAARPPGVVDSLRRLTRRHRLAAAAATGVVAAFVVAFIGISLFAIRAERLREAAERERTRADAEAETSRQRLCIANLRSLQAALDAGNLRVARQLFSENTALVAQPMPLEMRVFGGALDDALQVITPRRGAVAALAYAPDGGALGAAVTPALKTFVAADARAVADVNMAKPEVVFFSASGVPYRPLETLAAEWVGPWLERAGRPPGVARRVDRSSPRLAVTADGTRIVMQREDGRVSIIDAASGSEVAELAEHRGRVLAVAVSPDGRRAAIQAIDGTLRLWDGQSGACLGRCGRRGEAVGPFLFSPDGSRLASVVSRPGNTEEVQIFAADDGRLSGTGLRKKARAASRSIITFSPDGTRLAGTLPDGGVTIWSTADGAVLASTQDHPVDITALCWSPDGRWLVSGAVNGHLHVRDGVTGALSRQLLAHDADVLALAFHPDGETLASGSQDGTIRTWPLTAPVPLAALTAGAGLAAATFSADGRQVAVVPRDAADVEIWDVPAVRRSRVLPDAVGPVAGLAFSPDGRLLATTARQPVGDIVIHDVRTGDKVATLAGNGKPAGTVAFCPAGQRVLAAAQEGDVIVWNLATAARTAHVATEASKSIDEPGAAFALGGRAVAMQQAKVIDADTGDRIAKLTPRGNVTCLAVSSDGRLRASGMAIGTIYIDDLAVRKSVASWQAHGDRVGAMAFSGDGTTLASAAFDGTISLWDARSGALLRVLHGHEGSVEYVVFTPDGRRLISASTDGTTRIWDAASGHELCSLPSQFDAARAALLSPDGRVLLVAAPEGRVRLWGLSNADVAAARSLSESPADHPAAAGLEPESPAAAPRARPETPPDRRDPGG